MATEQERQEFAQSQLLKGLGAFQGAVDANAHHAMVLGPKVTQMYSRLKRDLDSLADELAGLAMSRSAVKLRARGSRHATRRDGTTERRNGHTPAANERR